MPRTKPAPAWSRSRTGVPTRVMICMFATTYGESDTMSPNLAMGEDKGPMEYGITYIVRPVMLPAYFSRRVAFISAGSDQLLVGPASSLDSEQMNVRSST